MKTVLVIDDNEGVREGVKATAQKEGYTCYSAASGKEGLELFRKHRPEFVISDLKMAEMDGIEVLQAVREIDPDAVMMLITAFGTVEVAVTAMKLGAFDFITKPFSPQLLRLKLQAAANLCALREDRSRLRSENEYLKDQIFSRPQPQRLIGESRPFREVMSLVERVARTDSTVLLLGESGTGKELVAREIHDQSGRSSGPFIKVNCGALTETLLESEIFGHEKGAFTGALKRKIGRFELADGGTIFLDEIGDITPGLQLKLLRVLQEREFERVGGEHTLRVDVRVISATNRNLREMVEAGTFREDLFYRLHIVPIQLPPLRERPADVPILAQAFLEKLRNRTRSRVTGFSPEALELLGRYPWPGNVRELENMIEQTLVFAQGSTVEPDDLPAVVRRSGAARGPLITLGQRALPDLLKEIERDLIVQAYTQARGVKTETARLLGIKTSALYYKLKAFGLWKEDDGDGEAAAGDEEA
ncbi:MAG: sigma-54 dependent transcriptional regulator [Myxococcota bacterium]|jgi:two-component system response regulator HydG|nr:sigma-54 dependent transcriptional regulator [Myxococcota bacterium]